MTWVRTEDDMPLHPKLLRLSDGAYRLWSNGLHFANRAVTDGRIDKALVSTLNHHGRWTARSVAGFVGEVVAAGLWLDMGEHYAIHDYAHHQAEAMKGRVEARRAYERDKKRRHRERTDSVPQGQQPGHQPVSNGASSLPTRPVPSREESANALSASAREGAPPRSENGRRAEALRAGYADRFSQAFPKLRLPGHACPGGGGPWLEIARELDDSQVSTLLDAYFADAEPFTRDKSPAKILSQRVRLLAHVAGEPARPTDAVSVADRAYLEAEAAHDRAIKSGADPLTIHRLEVAAENARKALSAARKAG